MFYNQSNIYKKFLIFINKLFVIKQVFITIHSIDYDNINIKNYKIKMQTVKNVLEESIALKSHNYTVFAESLNGRWANVK